MTSMTCTTIHIDGVCLPVMQSNPFGDAKPIDAEAKIREIEERENNRRVSQLLLGNGCLHMSCLSVN